MFGYMSYNQITSNLQICYNHVGHSYNYVTRGWSRQYRDHLPGPPTGTTYRDHLPGPPTGTTYWEHLPGPPTGTTHRDHLPGPPRTTTCQDHRLGPPTRTTYQDHLPTSLELRNYQGQKNARNNQNVTRIGSCASSVEPFYHERSTADRILAQMTRNRPQHLTERGLLAPNTPARYPYDGEKGDYSQESDVTLNCVSIAHWKKLVPYPFWAVLVCFYYCLGASWCFLTPLPGLLDRIDCTRISCF